MGDGVEQLPTVRLVEDQVSEDLAVNVAILQQDFSAKGLYYTPVGRIPWLDNCGMKRLGHSRPSTIQKPYSLTPHLVTRGQTDWGTQGCFLHLEPLPQACDGAELWVTGLLRRMENKPKGLQGKLELEHSKKTESNDVSTGDQTLLCTMGPRPTPVQLTMPCNDVHVDHSTAQLLEHLDDGALARGNASR